MRWLLSSFFAILLGACPVLAADEFAAFTVDVKLKGTGLENLEINITCDFLRPLSLDLKVPVDDSRTFTVPVPEQGGKSCILTTGDLPAHILRYMGDGGSTYDVNAAGCRFTEVMPGHSNFCQIQVESQETTLTVFKRWVGTSEQEADVPALLDCGPEATYDPVKINKRKPASWSLSIHTSDGVTCNVREPDSDDYTADTSDCQGLVILAGAEEECTIVNTKVVKMIEALNRYGLVLMILIYMVAGGFAVRRII